MSRTPRKKSSTGIYHVMLRGADRRIIFSDDEDCNRFLETMKRAKGESGFRLYAWCLMGNHVHLLLKEGNETLEQVFKRIGGRFVYWYNVKYQRVGHLFQDRFKSEPVDSDAYLLTVIRYIHQNPVKAGLCERPEDYPYSSWKEYLSQAELADVSFTETLIDREELLAFHKQLGNENCLDIAEKLRIRITDEQARDAVKKISGCDNVAEFQKLTPINRDKAILKLRDQHLSLRQISRLTGVSLTIVRRIVEE